jgi:hypothetical protein
MWWGKTFQFKVFFNNVQGFAEIATYKQGIWVTGGNEAK